MIQGEGVVVRKKSEMILHYIVNGKGRQKRKHRLEGVHW